MSKLALFGATGMQVFRAAPANIDWTCVSPAAFIESGTRTGHYRTDTDQLVVDDKGESRISAKDFAPKLYRRVLTGPADTEPKTPRKTSRRI